MTKRLAVAGLQLAKNVEDEDANLEHFEEVVMHTKRRYPWVDLIFTGELYLSDFAVNGPRNAQPIPNELTERLSALAKRVGSWLVPGSFYEQDNAHLYNTLLVFDPEGRIVAKYRKLFPWKPYESSDYGTECVTFDIPGIARVGVAICYDVWFPEVFRTLAWMGAEVILQPSATYTPDRQAELVLAPAQAIMNQCYVLNSNVILPQGGGRSIFVDPEGRILQLAGTHEEIMTEVIDIDRVRWVRNHGSFGISPVWKALRDSPLKGRFPVYTNLPAGRVFEDLSETRIQKSTDEWT
ncbi:MAG: carbon-nitrogen hydrolase family protein [Candidatus Thorarchaeota archaeon]